eukprot:jgi/Chlat1/7066/Chrsp57S06726
MHCSMRAALRLLSALKQGTVCEQLGSSRRQWSRQATTTTTTTATGLFGYPQLRAAAGFRVMAREAMERCQYLEHEIKRAPPSINTLNMLDDLSNTVCKVVDAAELCRSVHTDREFVQAAQDAYMQLSHYIQSLNSSPSLYHALVRAMNAGCMQTEEQRMVASMLKHDFERVGGVHLSDAGRQHVVELNNHITALESEFACNIATQHGRVVITPPPNVNELPPSLALTLHRKAGGDGQPCVEVVTEPFVLASMLKWLPDSQMRQQVYLAGYGSPKDNLRVLDELIAARDELACMLDSASYSHYMISPLLAKDPNTVVTFLDTLSTELRPRINYELASLRAHKERSEPQKSPTIMPWDRSFYVGQAKATACNIDGRTIAAFFPLESCLAGLGLLVKELFAIVMREETVLPGEVWAADVRKLVLRDPKTGGALLGEIYLDLHPRPGKYTHSAQFTIRCGKSLSNTEYQTPVLALVCNFPKSLPNQPSLITHGEFETLLHEFGHAMHSILSRTTYQHVAGTRGALDMVELPSHLFQYFAWDYSYLRQFARHYSTGLPIPEPIVQSLSKSKHMFAALETQMEVFYASMALKLFGPQPLGGSTTDVVAELHEQHLNMPHVPNTFPQARVSHLISYGPAYYTYPYATCMAARAWHGLFAGHSLNPDAGLQLRNKLLKWGGAKDPALLLSEFLGANALVEVAGGIAPSCTDYLKEAQTLRPRSETAFL